MGINITNLHVCSLVTRTTFISLAVLWFVNQLNVILSLMSVKYHVHGVCDALLTFSHPHNRCFNFY